jgi:RecA-family ATPase
LDQGGFFLGTLQARKCDVLYCALEDTTKRIQKRVLKQGITAFNGSRLETKRRSVPDLRNYLKANPQYRVVIIDTFQKMMGINDLNDYAQTVNGMSALKDIADSLNIAVIVIIHHNRKGGDLDGDHMESALGSTGINATADTTLTMRRKRGTSEATLSVTGRDMEDTAYILSWDKEICSWTVTNQAALKPTLSEAQQQIIDLLKSEDRNFTTAEIAKATGIQKYEVSRQATSLAGKGLIEKPIYGQWKAKDQFASLQSSRERQTTDTTPFNGQLGTNPPDVPGGMASEEYRECYDTAYSVFINEGMPPDEADQKAREEIRKFIAGDNPPGFGTVVSPPAYTETEPPPLTTPYEEIDF